MKEKIEKEIDSIDKLYDKVYLEIKKAYKDIYEKLKLEEESKIEKLKNEVTKTKEKLENSLSESNQSITANERINKGIKIMEKEKNVNMLNILTYVSKINKNNKCNKALLGTLMKNINLSFNEKNNDIIYDEYYFNGIPIIKNIEIEDITSSSVKLIWKIDDNIYLDKKEIKFKIELKKVNEDDIKVYESENNNYIIKNLIPNMNYELRICSFYDKVNSLWSQVIKVQTNKAINSSILEESNRKSEFSNKILEWTGCKSLDLIYRGTRDGSSSKIFHEKCDNQGPTVCLYKNEKNNIFGGFVSISWENEGCRKSAKDSFLFTLTNMHGIEPTKFENSNFDNSVFHREDLGPCFSSLDIVIYKDFLNENSWAKFPSHYKDTSGKGNSIFTGDADNNKTNFKIKEIEVFRVCK